MKSMKQALQAQTIDEVVSEIHERRKLLQQMVGSLYPRIVEEEIGQLVGRYKELGGSRLAEDLYAKRP